MDSGKRQTDTARPAVLTVCRALPQNSHLFQRIASHMTCAHHPFQAMPPCMTDAGLSRRRSVLFAFTFSPPIAHT
ncbi:hypothetical protein PMM47T1_08541 [Pseudomonas sp. M47T1]|nr:hypothetical protein PMM47T1_08541 [Pseudomonas sp. M47T1]